MRTPEEDAAAHEYVSALMDGTVTIIQQAAATSRNISIHEAEFLEAERDFYLALDEMSLDSLEGSLQAFATLRKQVGVLAEQGRIVLKAQRRFEKTAEVYVHLLERAPSEVYALAADFEQRASKERFRDIQSLYRANAESFRLQARRIISRRIKIKPEIEHLEEGFEYVKSMQAYLTATYPALEVMTSADGIETEHMIRLLRTHLRDFEKLRKEMTDLRDRLRVLRDEDQSAVADEELQEAIEEAKRDAESRPGEQRTEAIEPHIEDQASSQYFTARVASISVLALVGFITASRKRRRSQRTPDTTYRYTKPQLRKKGI